MNRKRLQAVLRVRSLQERGARGELARRSQEHQRAVHDVDVDAQTARLAGKEFFDQPDTTDAGHPLQGQAQFGRLTFARAPGLKGGELFQPFVVALAQRLRRHRRQRLAALEVVEVVEPLRVQQLRHVGAARAAKAVGPSRRDGRTTVLAEGEIGHARGSLQQLPSARIPDLGKQDARIAGGRT